MRKNEGITLTVLIITILVMLILTAVTINTVTGGKLIEKAQEAITKYQLKVFEDELETYHAKKELKTTDEDYNPEGLYAYYDKIVYMPDEYTANIDSSRDIYDILDSLQGSKFDGDIYIKEGKIVFEPGEYTVEDRVGELTVASSPNPQEEKIDAVILYDAQLQVGQELQYKLNDGDFQVGARYSADVQAPTVTVPITKEYVNSLQDKTIIVYAQVYDTNKNKAIANGQLIVTIPTAPTDIEITSAENTITVMATGSTDPNGLGIKGYMYSIDDGDNWTEVILEGRKYIFSDINSNTEKTIIAKAVNLVGFESGTYSKAGKTKSLSGLTIIPDIPNDKWTPDDVNLTVVYDGKNKEVPDGYAIEYTLDDPSDANSTWNLYQEAVLIENNQTTLTARLKNTAVNETSEDETSYTVSNIDKVPPTIPTNVQVTPEENALTVGNATGSTDTLSGVRGYKYSINAGEEGECWTDTLSGNESYTFENLPSGTTKKVTVMSVDNVDWESEPYETNVSTLAKYYIHYDKNIDVDVSNMPADQEKSPDQALILASETPTTIGYTFNSWNTEKNGSGTSYLPGAQFTTNADTTLYAQWEADPYTITLDNQGATTSGTTAIYEKYRDGIYLDSECATYKMTINENPITLPVKTGHTFEGYYTEPNGAGTQMLTATGYLTEDFYETRFEEDTTLYASWHENELTIYYYPNGGTNTHDDVTSWQWQTAGEYSGSGKQVIKYSKIEKANIWDVKSVFTREGYHVTAGSYPSGGVATPNDDPTAWIMNSPNSGLYAHQNDDKTEGVNHFENLIANGDAVLKLYANWQVNTGTVYYYKNGDDVTAASGKSIYDSGEFEGASTSVSNIKYTDGIKDRWDVTSLFQRTGYYVESDNKAWILDSPDSGRYVSQVASNFTDYLRNDTNVIIKVYANWKDYELTVYYCPNGGTVKEAYDATHYTGDERAWQWQSGGPFANSGRQIIKYSEAANKNIWNVSSVFSKTGYHVTNGDDDDTAWLLNSTDTTHASTVNQTSYDFRSFIEDEDSTIYLYANWKENELSIYYHPNGATVKDAYKGNNNTSSEPRRWIRDESGPEDAPGKQIVLYSEASNKNIWNVTSLFTRTGYHVANNNASETAWRNGSATSTNYITQDANDFTNLIANGNADLNLYANWESNVHNLTINPNGGMMYLPGGTVTTNSYTMAFNYGVEKLFMETSGWIDNGNMSTSPWLGTSGSGYINGEFLPYRQSYVFTGWTITTGGGTITDHAWNSNSTNHVGLVHDYIFNSDYDGDVTITANWANSSYTVTYNPNTGSGDTDKTVGNMPTTQNKALGTNLTLSSNVPTRKGYTFASWNTNSNGTGTNYAPGATYSTDANLTLYAKWTANELTFNNQSKSSYYNTSAKTVTITGASNGTGSYAYSITSQPSGSYFTISGTTITIKASTPVGSYSVKVKATDNNSNKYKEATMTITVKYPALSLNGNGGTAVNGTVYTKYGTVNEYSTETGSTAAVITASRTGGYTLTGWYTAASGGTKVLNADGTGTGTAVSGYTDASKKWVMTGAKTLYAQWTVKTVTVTFMRNQYSGDTTSATQTFTYGVSGQTFSNKGWSQTGYTQGRWFYNQACTGTSHSINAGVSNDWIENNAPSVTLYASWTAKDYTLTLDPNGGSYNNSTETSSKTMTFGAINNNSIGVATKAGYDFKGWYTAASGGNQVYDSTGQNIYNYTYWTDAYPSGKWNYAGKVTLYAQWEAKTYTLTLNPNGGSYSNTTGTSTKTMKYGLTNNNSIGAATRTGYTFNGWYTAASGGTQVYDKNGNNKKVSPYWTAAYSSGVWNYTENVTLYAQWTANTYTLTLNPNGGSYSNTTGTSTKTMTFGSNKNNSIGVATREGYDFNGWYTATSEGIQVYNSRGENIYNYTYWTDTYSSGKWNYANNIILYAQWKPHTYKVRYNANGGTGTMADSNHVYGTSSALSANKFKKTNYVFDKWTRNKNGTGGSYNDGANVSTLTNVDGGIVNLYAQWKPAPAQVTEKKALPAVAFDGASTYTNPIYKTSRTYSYTADSGASSNMFCLIPKNLELRISDITAQTMSYEFFVENINKKYTLLGGSYSHFDMGSTGGWDRTRYKTCDIDYVLGIFVGTDYEGFIFPGRYERTDSICEVHISDPKGEYEIVRQDFNRIVSSITSDVFANQSRDEQPIATGYKAYVLGEDLKVGYNANFNANSNQLTYYKYTYNSVGQVRLSSGTLTPGNGQSFVTTPTIDPRDTEFYMPRSYEYTTDFPEVYFFHPDVQITSIKNNAHQDRVYQISNEAYFYKEVITPNPGSGMVTKYNIGTVDGNTTTYQAVNEKIITSSETVYIEPGGVKKLKITVTDTNTGKETVTEKTIN